MKKCGANCRARCHASIITLMPGRRSRKVGRPSTNAFTELAARSKKGNTRTTLKKSANFRVTERGRSTPQMWLKARSILLSTNTTVTSRVITPMVPREVTLVLSM